MSMELRRSFLRRQSSKETSAWWRRKMAAVFSGYEETRLGNILLWKRLFYPDLSISFLLGKRYDPMYVLTTFSSSKLLSFK